MWKFLLLFGGGFLIVALGLGWLAIDVGFVPLQLKGDAFAESLNVLASLFVIALFVERAVQVFFAGAWEEQREGLRAQLAGARAADDTQLAQRTAKRILAIRGEVRTASHIVSSVLGVLVALGGITLLSALVQAPPAGTGWQAIFFRAADIAITAGLIAGGSKVIHEIMEVITQNVSRFRPAPPDDQLASAGMATAAAPPPAQPMTPVTPSASPAERRASSPKPP